VVGGTSTAAVLKDRVAYRSCPIGKDVSNDNQFAAKSVVTVRSQKSSFSRGSDREGGSPTDVESALIRASRGQGYDLVSPMVPLTESAPPLVKFEELFYEWGECPGVDLGGPSRMVASELTRLYGLSLEVEEDEMNKWIGQAETEFGKNQLVGPAMKTPSYPGEMILVNDLSLREFGLDETIESKLSKLRWRGEDESSLRRRLIRFPEVDVLLDVKSVGPKYLQYPSWKPNGGVGFRQRVIYKRHQAACNQAMLDLAAEGKVLLFSRLAAAPWISQLHFSPLTWAPKPTEEGMDPKGRTCFNLSAGGASSVNRGTNLDESDSLYPLERLPDIRTICEMLCSQRELHGDEPLHGATVDVSKAYTQYQNSVATSKMFGTFLQFGKEEVLAVYLVGAFGYTRAGHIYCLFARAIDHLHNNNRSIPASVTYIDDGILVGPQSTLGQDVVCYCSGVTAIFGPEACNEKKTKNSGTRSGGVGLGV
jgi:hypothetical protein